ncbi:unnamed protein product [Tuber melanosporum]|uniref:(Perigord truffle) hypothetical protein n=1 Tax=Tuber melanosporum (strain Mel28) TaxID=656061 RepID=D5G615_TUBMM|nr:uncharacterized protein GSTUM_00001536001 [Tuber melanosporum]CAZ79958.1 unnamed protein product [Tuber melanosporum]
MIPINESNTINIKLFTTYAAPPRVKAFHLPVCTVQLERLMDINWDLTMQKIVPFIDGINSVRMISELADADYNLTRKCIEHLLYHSPLSGIMCGWPKLTSAHQKKKRLLWVPNNSGRLLI